MTKTCTASTILLIIFSRIGGRSDVGSLIRSVQYFLIEREYVEVEDELTFIDPIQENLNVTAVIDMRPVCHPSHQ